VPSRLVIAHLNADGSATADAHVGPSWFTVTPGSRVDLGVVRPAGTARPSIEPVSGAVHQCPGGTTGTTSTSGGSTIPISGRADLPYDVKLNVGDSFKLTDAFLEKGPAPAAVLQVTMDGASWRLSELQSSASFTVTQADCDHQGNRDVGRDRIFVTWQNADGSKETDHLDLRYCESGSVSQPLEDSSSGSDLDSSPESETEVEAGECEPVEVEGCGEAETTCDHADALEPSSSGGVCGGNSSGGTTTTPTGPAPIN
jgi:hypothetical protein